MNMFREADLIVMPTCTEGFGLVALEAISAGFPVLVSSEFGITKALQSVNVWGCCLRLTKGRGRPTVVGNQWWLPIKEIYRQWNSYEKGTTPTCIDIDGWNMLHSATQGRVPEIIALILSHPLDIDPRTAKGYMPLTVGAFFPKVIM